MVFCGWWHAANAHLAKMNGNCLLPISHSFTKASCHAQCPRGTDVCLLRQQMQNCCELATRMRILLVSLVCLLATYAGKGQPKSNLGDTSIAAFLLQVHYAHQFPFAAMAERFGNNNAIGAALKWKLSRNWLIALDGAFLFGGNLKEDTIIDGLMTRQGFFIGTHGLAASVLLFERGLTLTGSIGKLFPWLSTHPNAGLQIVCGAGFMQHKIKIEDPEGVVPYVTGAYAKGYDRLTSGMCLRQYIGYLHLDPRKRLNFEVGVEALEGFTRNRRSWNFDQKQRDERKRLDVLVGLRITWMLPFYGRHEKRFYYY